VLRRGGFFLWGLLFAVWEGSVRMGKKKKKKKK
jgi:hypothetical protein